MAAKITAKDPKPTSERIEQLANRVLIGDIVLPEFQRPFVWKRKQILELLDSIYRNYPIGSALVWESKQELASKRAIADLEVGARSENYPVNYLLDGQQRLSTICGVLHWEPGDPKSVWNVVFDLKSERFTHIDHAEELPTNLIPLRRLSNAAEYFSHVGLVKDEYQRDNASLLFNRFKDYQLPLVTLGDMSINDVAPVFERINSTGTRLTIYDLMRAATWSPNFDLGKTIDSIKVSLESKRFHNLDNKTFLRILGAACGGDFSSTSIDGLRELDQAKLVAAADSMKNASQRAADFLATEIGVPRSEALPYANQFAVLSELFRVLPSPSAGELLAIKNWFWTTTLSGYFGGWDNSQMDSDAKAVRAFAKSETTHIPAGVALPTDGTWRSKTFRSNSAVSKLLALMLAQGNPVDLLNAQKIDVDKSLAWSNDKEFHHFFPKAYLASVGVDATRANLVGNIVLLTSASNIAILDKAPSVYLQKIIDTDGRDALVSRLASNLVPEDALDAALSDDYDEFLIRRARHLHKVASDLTGKKIKKHVAAEEVDDTDEDPTE